jgi:hypothetical protein
MAILASDLDALTEFIADPTRASARAGLSDADRTVLLSGSAQQIYERVSANDVVTAPAAPPKDAPR